MIYQYAQQASTVIASMAANFQTVARTRTDVASAEPIWQAPPRPADPGLAVEGRSPADWDRIDVSGISYSRGEQGRGVLQHVSITLRRGERIALVGPSGSGKSTLMRVLAGLYEPASAEVRVNDQLRAGVRHLGSVSTLIPQEAEVFESTVRENITFGAPHTEGEILAAVHVSAFDETLSGMAQGLDTPISERGFNMSGGQRQRLSLARGVLAAQGSAAIFLDEPTSALDAITEAAVIRRLGQHFPDACLVVSVHRMSLLEHFDRVVLMADGRVLDTGPVREVAARQPLLAEMLRGRASAEAQSA
jgi:ABC-type bacteriocin/lantibiotic exporter with double-glycine peptidase domain